MKMSAAWAACALMTLTAFSASAQYNGPKTVYILPMAGGLDQYLAERLTRDHLMQVTTDPATAEVFMTDRLGVPFEQKMRELRPSGEKKSDAGTQPRFQASRARGTVFLVDAGNKRVLWSDHHAARSKSDRDMNRAARRIAKDLTGPGKSVITKD